MNRPFLPPLTCALATCLALGPLPSRSDQPSSPLAWPPVTSEAKPWAYWWWMGSAVGENDLSRNLEQYRAAGMGGVLAVLLDDGDPWVRVWIPERRFVDVQPGTPAEIRLDGREAPLVGRVLDIAREPAFTPHFALTERDRAHLVYRARVVIPGAPTTLRPGVPADVRLLVGDRVAASP